MKKYYLISFFSMFLVSIVFSGYIKTGLGYIYVGPLYHKTLTNTYINYEPISYDTSSYDYKNLKKRLYFEGIGVLKSDVYGDFDTLGKVDLIKSTSVNSKCVGETVSYYYSGNFFNDKWGSGFKTIIDTNNYFCPNSGIFSISLVSDNTNNFFENIVLNGVLENKGGSSQATNNNSVDDRIIFSNLRLSVSGLMNNTNLKKDEFQGGNLSQSKINTYLGINYDSPVNFSNFGQVFLNINKNINKYTLGKSWIKDMYSINNLNDELLLLDFEGQNESIESNKGNKGKLFTLNNGGKGIEVNGEKTLILKGGNLYIKDDIYNKDLNSKLTIIVKRDVKNNNNGGNIYVDPRVTNIDAIIISEGSLMNFNGLQILNSIDNDVNVLRNQLLIYGSLISRNTLSENKSVYNTDDYIYESKSELSNNYNLENLRTFQVVKSEQIQGNECNQDGKITAVGLDEKTALKYAFAGKKECYYDGVGKLGLRTTLRTASTVIEYNPIIQTNPPKILRIN